jgi:NADH-quinone oxidoreductase subunit A
MTPVFVEKVAPIPHDVAKGWAMVAFGDIFVFFGVLMVGFAYVWRRGDINWVRSYAHHEEPPIEPEKTLEQPAHMPPPAPVPVASHH